MKNFLILICFCLFCACENDENAKTDVNQQQLCHIKVDLDDEEYAFDETISLEYDSSGNLVKKSDGIDTVIYTYDSNNRKIGEERYGYLEEEPNELFVWSYDQDGRLLTKIHKGPWKHSYTKEDYTYDKQGQLETYERYHEFAVGYPQINILVTYHHTEFHQYSYNSLDQLANEIVDLTRDPAKIEKYDPSIKEMTIPDVSKDKETYHYSINYVYDGNGRLIEKTVKCDKLNGENNLDIGGWVEGETFINLGYEDEDEWHINVPGYSEWWIDNEDHDLGFSVTIDQCSDLLLSFTYEYDENGNITYASLFRSDQDQNFSQSMYGYGAKKEISWNYDGNQRIIEATYKQGNGDDKTTKTIKRIWAYSSDGKLSKSYYSTSSKYIELTYYTYDEKGRLAEETFNNVMHGDIYKQHLRYVYGDCTTE